MGKSEKHQLRLFPAATISLAPVPPLAHTYAYATAHLRHHSHALTPSPLRTTVLTLAHLRLRRCASATPLSRTYAITLAHPRHHTHAPTPTSLRICIPTSKQGCARSFGISHSFLRSFTIIGTYPLNKSFKVFIQIVLSIRIHPFNDLYKSFKGFIEQYRTKG